MISNSKPVSRIDTLIQDGLGHDLRRLPYYRIVMTDPHAGFYNTIYREYAVEIMNNLLNYVLNDSQMFNRLRQLLQAEHPSLSKKAFESLMTKAVEHNIPLDTLIEVYERGYNNNTTQHLTNEQYAFNRVNSYIAKGKAYTMDTDLAESNAVRTIKKVARGKNG
jgi:hypothetical protein